MCNHFCRPASRFPDDDDPIATFEIIFFYFGNKSDAMERIKKKKEY